MGHISHKIWLKLMCFSSVHNKRSTRFWHIWSPVRSTWPFWCVIAWWTAWPNWWFVCGQPRNTLIDDYIASRYHKNNFTSIFHENTIIFSTPIHITLESVFLDIFPFFSWDCRNNCIETKTMRNSIYHNQIDIFSHISIVRTLSEVFIYKFHFSTNKK